MTNIIVTYKLCIIQPLFYFLPDNISLLCTRHPARNWGTSSERRTKVPALRECTIPPNCCSQSSHSRPLSPDFWPCASRRPSSGTGQCVSQLLFLKWSSREHKGHFTSTVSKHPSSFWQFPLDKIPGVGSLHQRVWDSSWLLTHSINLLSKGAALRLHTATSDVRAPCVCPCRSWVWQFCVLICANLIGVKLNLILICISLIIMKVECFL